MRLHLTIAMSAVAVVLAAPAARAETRLFVIANNPDGYGVDRCLATGARCGGIIASAYCRSQDFAEARSFRRIDHNEITLADAAPAGANSGEYVAIECTR
jgi:hypothetical protein